jgi:hypothetical protein
MPIILRTRATKTATIAASGSLSGAINMADYSMLVVHMPATWTAASLGFHISSSKGGTYLPLYDDDGNLIQIDSPTASKAFSAPAAVAACSWVKFWSQDGSAGNTAQAAERVLTLELKS